MDEGLTTVDRIGFLVYDKMSPNYIINKVPILYYHINSLLELGCKRIHITFNEDDLCFIIKDLEYKFAKNDKDILDISTECIQMIDNKFNHVFRIIEIFDDYNYNPKEKKQAIFLDTRFVPDIYTINYIKNIRDISPFIRVYSYTDTKPKNTSYNKSVLSYYKNRNIDRVACIMDIGEILILDNTSGGINDNDIKCDFWSCNTMDDLLNMISVCMNYTASQCNNMKVLTHCILLNYNKTRIDYSNYIARCSTGTFCNIENEAHRLGLIHTDTLKEYSRKCTIDSYEYMQEYLRYLDLVLDGNANNLTSDIPEQNKNIELKEDD